MLQMRKLRGKFALTHGKMIANAHLKLIKINYSRTQQFKRVGLMKNIKERVSSISTFN